MSCVSAADNLTDNTLETDSNSAVQSDASSIAQDAEIASEINVTFDEKVYAENLTDITVDLPETAQGNLEVRINNYSIYHSGSEFHSDSLRRTGYTLKNFAFNSLKSLAAVIISFQCLWCLITETECETRIKLADLNKLTVF